MDKNKEQLINPGLYLVSTPIGNMEDITLRALNILKKSDIILCEDTRRSSKLLSHFKIKKNLVSYHKFNERKSILGIINEIKKNKIISLISDAGTPTISDPGTILVNQCIEESLNVYPIPGPSAVTSAVSVSGFSSEYLFYGFLPKKEKELNNILKSLINLNYTIVFFVPAAKINFYILQFKKYFFDRKILIGREMTKMHEEFIRSEVKSVKNLEEAISHINKYGTMHTDCIITEDSKSAKKFLNEVKSSIAMHNTSTQFADGGEFGFGGEVGISTNRLPPRGPVGLNQLISYKYQVTSKGKIRK